jgi:hypothetical protein
MNANNGIPFDPNPELFRKSPRNGIIKKIPYNELKLEIIFFGEIRLHKKTYYKYAFYIRNSKKHFLSLEERTDNRSVKQPNNFTTNHPTQSHLTFASTPIRIQHTSVSSPFRLNIPNTRQSFSTKRNEKTILHVCKINKSFVNQKDLNALNEEINISSNVNQFQTDPNGITLLELTKNNSNNSDIPFKIIRKSKLSSFQFDEPHVLFGKIIINEKTYYKYACYKSKGPHSVNGVTFRELKNVSNRRPKTIMSNRNNLERIYLFFIQIGDIKIDVLRRLLRFIEKIRINTSNNSFLRTIYKCVSDHVGINNNNNNVHFSNNGNAMQLQQIESK